MKIIKFSYSFLISALFCICAFNVQAQFVELKDGSSKNRFLGPARSMCKTTSITKGKNVQKSYDCGNKSVSGLLNVNFLSPEMMHRQFYFFNDFIYWLGNHSPGGRWNGKNDAADRKESLAATNPDKFFSGKGVFMIVLGTSPYLNEVVAPGKTCPDGQTLMIAQLKYNNGHSIANWSQDSICLASTDTFKIHVSKDQDNTVPLAGQPSDPSDDPDGIDWMKDAGPTENYTAAGGSPRKIRLIKQ